MKYYDIDRDPQQHRFDSFQYSIKRYDKEQRHMVYCKCGHSIYFSGVKDRMNCNWCGRWVYKDEKTKMKYKVKECMIKCK